jgi:hypothetical protein
MDNAMKKLGYFLRSRFSSGEAGQALILVLIFLLLGSLTLVPTLTHISTALKTGEIYEQNTNELYTADSGIEDALWRIKYDFMGPDYNPYDFETAWPYQTEDINGMVADYTISNVWFPTNVNLVDPYATGYINLTPEEIQQMMESEKLKVEGSNDFTDNVSPYTYKISIEFTPDLGDNLTIKSLGVWLPRDYTYTDNSCSLQAGGQFTLYNPDHITSAEAPGGWTVVWSYDAPYPCLSDFPGYATDGITMTFDFTFCFTSPPDQPDQRPAAIAWTTTQMKNELGIPQPPTWENVPVSWDIDTRYFKIVSTAGDTEIEAYSSKNELRQMGDAMSGDYVAIGNSLLADDNGDHKRETWHTPSSFDLNDPTDNVSIPANADVAYAFLYWAGWRNENAIINAFSDDCTDFSHWVRSSDVTRVRYPSGDISYSGDWDTTSNMYSYVDEVGANDGDTTYLVHGKKEGYVLFSFPAFNVSDGSSIQSLTVYLVAKDDTSGTNKMQPALRVGGTNYLDSPSVSTEVNGNYTTISYTYTYNPRRGVGSAWTSDDINGIGPYALQGFGAYSADANPKIRLTQVYAQVDYNESLWTISSNQFRGRGSSSTDPVLRTLTLKNSLDFSSYTAKTVAISWHESSSNTLEPDDAMYFAFSGDGGATWSPNYEAFHGNVVNDRTAFGQDMGYKNFCYSVPQDYVTGNFKIRFYFNFDSPSEYVNIDDIRICYLTPDTSITFKIDNLQVYLNGWEPADGPNPLTAGRTYTMLNTMWGDPYGYSYMCVRDVSALVKKYPVVPGEEHHTGNAKYTVDGVTADIRNPNNSLSDFAFAGWSLIIVYACPETAGHYIYIRDDNFAFHPGTGGDLDFDEDGTPGGTITGFKIPNPITDKYGHIIETVAAKLTCFVVEGDDFGNDTSSIVVTGQSGHSKTLTNPSCSINDVWNGRSWPGTFNEGVDIDTFVLYWSDNILSPKDNELQVDLYSLNDAWNLVYFIISIRSETITSGTTYYVIYGG